MIYLRYLNLILINNLLDSNVWGNNETEDKKVESNLAGVSVRGVRPWAGFSILDQNRNCHPVQIKMKTYPHIKSLKSKNLALEKT